MSSLWRRVKWLFRKRVRYCTAAPYPSEAGAIAVLTLGAGTAFHVHTKRDKPPSCTIVTMMAGDSLAIHYNLALREEGPGEATFTVEPWTGG